MVDIDWPNFFDFFFVCFDISEGLGSFAESPPSRWLMGEETVEK